MLVVSLPRLPPGPRLERWTKITLLRADADGLSAIEPEEYQRRFMKRLNQIFGLWTADDELEADSGNSDGPHRNLNEISLIRRFINESGFAPQLH